MQIDITTLPAAAQYKLITSTIVPRPIALVTTQDAQGAVNAAPYSFFNAMGEDPPILVLGLERRAGSEQLKDTTANIERSGQFVINLVDHAMAEAMNICAIDFPPGESEIDAAGLQLETSQRVAPPRVQQSPVSFECELLHLMPIAPRRHLAIGRAVYMHVRDGLLDPDTGYVSPERYQPLGRYFGRLYIKESQLFSMTVPTHADWLAHQNK
ncbi:MAG: flavin reductase family protein [Burkholderiaceae bacterium]